MYFFQRKEDQFKTSFKTGLGVSFTYLIYAYEASYVEQNGYFENNGKIYFVDLKSNSALLYNKGHNF